MRQLLVATLLLSLSLVWADGEEKATEDTEQTELPAFTPPPRPPGDVYFTEDFQDPDAVWSRSVVVTIHTASGTVPLRSNNMTLRPHRWVKSQAKKDDADDGVGLYDGKHTCTSLSVQRGGGGCAGSRVL